MTTTEAPRVHINRPPTFPLRRIILCPTERRRRRFSGVGAPWYGITWTCLGCGDSFGDGERLERPFARGWRAKAIAGAKQVWDAAAGLSREDYTAWMLAQLGPDLAQKADAS